MSYAMFSGYMEKVFAIVGVNVYAVGLYVSRSILSGLDAWKGIQDDSFLFNPIFQGNCSEIQSTFGKRERRC